MEFLNLLIGYLIPKAMASSPFTIYCEAVGTYCGDGQMFIIHLLDRVVMLLFQLIGGFSVIAIVVAGLKLAYSGENGKEDAKKIVTFALFGLALAIVGITFTRFACIFAAGAFGEDAAALCSIS